MILGQLKMGARQAKNAALHCTISNYIVVAVLVIKAVIDVLYFVDRYITLYYS